MTDKLLTREFTSNKHTVTVTWLGEGSVWATAVVVPPPASPEEFTDLAAAALQDKLINPRPNISVALAEHTDTSATYTIDGGGERKIDYGFKILNAEQSTVDYIGHCMLMPLRQEEQASVARNEA